MLLQKLRKGQYIAESRARDGKTIKFRGPKERDVADMLRFINGLVDEDAMILVNKKKTRSEEAEYIKKMIKANRDGSALHLVAEVEGHVVSKAEVVKKKGKSSHVGTLGISVSKKYRGIGLGKAMMKLLSELSEELGLRLILLEVYAENKPALHVYQKAGFKKVGYISKDVYHKGKYRDSITMAKELA